MLEYTLVLVSVAVPVIKSPPPCKPKTEHVTFHRGVGVLAFLGGAAGFEERDHSHTVDAKRERRGGAHLVSFNGAMEETSGKVQRRKHTCPA